MDRDLLFVGGDLSGIQKFIYNITSKRAMVSLKGRSQYLKDFAEDVCNKIILDISKLESCGMDKDEMKIYCSGGKFYLQVPDTDGIREAIDKIKHETERELWNEHLGQLSINIAHVPFCYIEDKVKVDDETDNIGILWKYITKKFSALKSQKFKSLLIDDYDKFFEVQNVGGNAKEKVCQVTGIEGAEEYLLKFGKNDTAEEKIRILPSVKAQIDLGLKLRNAQGYKMLEEYADGSYLGILRMDVDGLGARFITGFDSMNAYKDFSKKLDDFFTSEDGKLNQIQDELKDHLHVVYAGGDDIFVVGRWDKVIEFAYQLQSEFKEYCRQELKESLSISGGIAIVDPQFPIAKAAEMAGEAEDAAKKYNNGKKNAFNMFGETVSWDGEFGYVKRFKDKFVDLISPKDLSRSILHTILTYAAMVKENKVIEEEIKKGNTKRKPDLSYLWHTAYHLTRFMGKEKDNQAVYDFCKDLRDNKLLNPENYRLMSIAARWAELELRENNINNKNNNE